MDANQTDRVGRLNLRKVVDQALGNAFLLRFLSFNKK